MYNTYDTRFASFVKNYLHSIDLTLMCFRIVFLFIRIIRKSSPDSQPHPMSPAPMEDEFFNGSGCMELTHARGSQKSGLFDP